MAKRLTPELKAKLQNFHNATPAFLIDELGGVRARQKALKDEEDLLKTVLETKLKKEEEEHHIDFKDTALTGTRYVLQVIKTVRTTFSGEKAKEFLTAEQIEQCQVTTPVTQYRVSRKDDGGDQAHPAENGDESNPSVSV